MVNNQLAYSQPVVITKIAEKQGKRGTFLSFEADGKWYTCFENSAFNNIREAKNMATPVVIGYQPPTNAKFNATAKEVNFASGTPMPEGVKETPQAQKTIPANKLMLASYVKDLIVAGHIKLELWADVTDEIYNRLLNGKKPVEPVDDYDQAF